MRLLVALLGLALAGCGVPVDAEPRPYEEDVAGVVEAALEQPPIVPGVPGGGVTARIYFVEDEALVGVERQVADDAPRALLAVLLAGPGEGAAPEVRTAIPPTTRLLGVTATDGVVRVDLSSDFAIVGGDEEILAVGQIVLTLTSLDEVEGVRFALDGLEIPVPDQTGALSEEPLGAEHFVDLLLRESPG